MICWLAHLGHWLGCLLCRCFSLQPCCNPGFRIFSPPPTQASGLGSKVFFVGFPRGPVAPVLAGPWDSFLRRKSRQASVKRGPETAVYKCEDQTSVDPPPPRILILTSLFSLLLFSSISLHTTVFRWTFCPCHTGPINGLHNDDLGRDRHFRLTTDALTVAYFHQSRAQARYPSRPLTRSPM